MTAAKVIVLNGKRFDAVTGKYLGDSGVSVSHNSSEAVAVEVKKVAHKAAAPIRRPTAAFAQQHTADKTPDAESESTAIAVRRSSPHHVPTHKPQHSQTLMRHIVTPPAASLKRSARVQSPTDVLMKQPAYDITPKPFVSEVDESRLRRAKKVSQNGLIRHFGLARSPSPQSEPARQQRIPIAEKPVENRDPSPETTHQRSQEIFERAIARANSHKQPPLKAKHRTKRSRLSGVLSVSASSLAIVLIIGFIAYQNVNAIQIRLASSRAGVNATLPRWHPDGFSVGALSYKPGLVSIRFNDVADSRSFTVTQTLTNWDSSALLSDFVMPNNESFETLQASGNTIYAYGNNDATWVSGGVWYKLVSDGSLSTSQLVKLAASM